MKKKLFTIAAMMLCMVMLLSSCSLFSGNIKFNKFVDKDYRPEVDASRTTVEKVDISGKLLYPETGNLIVLQGHNKTTDRATYTVYNPATNKVIWKGENSFTKLSGGDETVEYTLQLKEVQIDNKKIGLAIVTKETRSVTSFAKTVYDVTVWAEDGSEVVTCSNVDKEKVQNSIWVAADLFSIQEKVYRVSKDGSVAYVFDWSSTRQKPAYYLTRAGEYYVDFSNYAGESSVSIYDNCLSTVITYLPPAYDVLDSGNALFDLASHTHILSNGNVIVQYVVAQDIMAKKYDFLLLGGKYNLHTVLLEAKTGKVKDLKLDYIIREVAFGTGLEDMGISKDVENVAVAYPIEDGRINQSGSAAKLLSMKNNGNIAGALELPIMGMTVEGGITAVAHNRWLINAVNGRSYIVDGNGKIVGEDFNVNKRNADFFLLDNKIYDWNLEVKCDLSNENIESIYVMNHSVFFKTKEGAFKLYANGELKTLAEAEAVANSKRFVKYLCEGAYLIMDANDAAGTKYEIYNDQGVLLDTIVGNKTPEFCAMTEDGIILLCAQVTNSATDTVYYRIG